MYLKDMKIPLDLVLSLYCVFFMQDKWKFRHLVLFFSDTNSPYPMISMTSRDFDNVYAPSSQ